LKETEILHSSFESTKSETGSQQSTSKFHESQFREMSSVS
jgi:hypothetical protein